MKMKEKAKKAASHIWKHKWKYAALTAGALFVYDDLKMRKIVKDIGLNRVLCTAAKIDTDSVATFREGKETMVEGLTTHVLDRMEAGTDLTGIIFYNKKKK